MTACSLRDDRDANLIELVGGIRSRSRRQLGRKPTEQVPVAA
ncbi:hypothetical protein [Streptomyces sp. NPDC055186]